MQILHDAAAAVAVELRLRLANERRCASTSCSRSQQRVHELIAQAARCGEVLVELVRGSSATIRP